MAGQAKPLQERKIAMTKEKMYENEWVIAYVAHHSHGGESILVESKSLPELSVEVFHNKDGSLSAVATRGNEMTVAKEGEVKIRVKKT